MRFNWNDIRFRHKADVNLSRFFFFFFFVCLFVVVLFFVVVVFWGIFFSLNTAQVTKITPRE